MPRPSAQASPKVATCPALATQPPGSTSPAPWGWDGVCFNSEPPQAHHLGPVCIQNSKPRYSESRKQARSLSTFLVLEVHRGLCLSLCLLLLSRPGEPGATRTLRRQVWRGRAEAHPP